MWSPVLREVTIPVLSTERCQEIYKRYGYSVSENQICAGLSEGGKDSCQVGSDFLSEQAKYIWSKKMQF
jgi:Trypsin